ncbi:MAG: stage II sporulation protein P [Ruminococcus sp.]|nr:stage II sporulation protein P [Ruminococcus sp.]
MRIKGRGLSIQRNNGIHIGRGILRILLLVICFMAGAAFLQELYSGARSQEKEDKGQLLVWLEDSVMNIWLPGMVETGKRPDDTHYNLPERLILENFPVILCGFGTQEEYDRVMLQESSYEELLLLEGTDENKKEIAEDALEYDENAIHLDKSLEEAFLAENEQVNENASAEGEEEILSTDTVFHEVEEPVYRYQWAELQGFEELKKAFYAIDSTTMADPSLLNAQKFLEKDMRMQGDNDKPQILIYHTHSQEGFADSVPGDDSTTIVGVGEKLASVLRDKYGYHVLHHTESFDRESRDASYGNALPAIEEVLAQNPTIEVVIDLHRDQMPEDRRLVVELQGRPTAQFMFFNGLSRSAKSGVIESLENPYLGDNLAFSFQMQTASNEYYPGIARRIYLKAYRYNLHMRPKSLLIELGAQNNTLEEAMNAVDPLAHILHLVLSGEEPDVD